MLPGYIRKTVGDIKSIKTQGATNVFIATVETLARYAAKERFKNRKDFIFKISKAGRALSYARPTEPLAQNALRFFLHHLEKSKSQDIADLRGIMERRSQEILRLIADNKEKIVEHGAKLIRKGEDVFTHCHSSTVKKIIVRAKDKVGRVFNTETRPLFQGRRTSRAMVENGIDTTMVADSFAPFLISRHSGRELSMEKVFLGGDLVTIGGSVANKVGSYGIALAARAEKVPVYIAVHLLKLNPTRDFTIETRSGREIWPCPPKGLKIINYAFDIVPARCITGIITEFGVLKPREVKKIAKEKYPWLFK